MRISTTIVGSPVTLELLKLLLVQLQANGRDIQCFLFEIVKRFQGAYTQNGGYKGKTGYSILHILSDLGMYKKSFATSHHEVNFQEKEEGKSWVLKINIHIIC